MFSLNQREFEDFQKFQRRIHIWCEDVLHGQRRRREYRVSASILGPVYFCPPEPPHHRPANSATSSSFHYYFRSFHAYIQAKSFEDFARLMAPDVLILDPTNIMPRPTYRKMFGTSGHLEQSTISL